MRLLAESVQDTMNLRPTIEKAYTERYIEDRLIDIVFSCQGISASKFDTALLKKVKKLLGTLQKTSISWFFLVPVVNLKLSGIKKVSIGEVAFYDLNPKTFKYLESKFGIKLGHQKPSAKRRGKFVKENVNVLAIVRVTAGETEKAKEIALLKVESCLNVFRLYDPTREMGVQREFFTVYGREDIYYQNIKTKGMGSSHGGPPPAKFFQYSIDRAKLKLWIKKGRFYQFSKLLKGVQSTSLAKKIDMSIYWYGLGVRDKRKVDSIVKLVVSLEALLLGKKDRLKKQSLADRVAFILGRDKNTREEMYELVAKIYALRSEIVHEGKHDVSEKDVLTLMQLTRTLIFEMMGISARLNSLEDIDKRIARIKFSSQIRGV